MNIEQFHRMQISGALERGVGRIDAISDVEPARDRLLAEAGWPVWDAAQAQERATAQALARLQRVEDVEQLRARQTAARGDWGVWMDDEALTQALARLQQVEDVEQLRARQAAARGDWIVWMDDGALTQALAALGQVEDVEQLRARQMAARGDWGTWMRAEEP